MSSQIATFATIFFSMILVNNYVLVQFLGICPFLGVSKKLDSSAGMGAAVIVVMVIATAVTFPLQIFLLDAYNLGYLQTIIFILVIAVLVQLIEITLKKYVPALYQSLGVYLPLITTNCCVLGVLHAKKDPEDVSYAISGSDQWVAKARSYLYLETCPNASDVAVCQQVDASYSDTVNAKIRFGIRECVGDDGETSWSKPRRPTIPPKTIWISKTS